MAFVAAKCTQCGSSIEVDDSKEAGICRYCGTAFVTQKVINNYNTYLTQHITKHIYGKEKTEAEEYLARGETFLRLKDWSKAIGAFMEAANAAPDNYKSWLGLVRSETKEFTDFSDFSHIEHYRKALAVANEEEKEAIKSLCARFIQSSKDYREKQADLANQKQKDAEALKLEKQAQLKKLSGQRILQLLICIFSLSGATLLFLLTVTITWIIMVPLGFVFLIAGVIFLIMFLKTDNKYQKLFNETQQSQFQVKIQHGDGEIEEIFKNFFK